MNARKLKQQIRYYLNMPKFTPDEAMRILEEQYYDRRYEIPMALSRLLIETMAKEYKKSKIIK